MNEDDEGVGWGRIDLDVEPTLGATVYFLFVSLVTL